MFGPLAVVPAAAADACVVATGSSNDGSGAAFFLLFLPFALVLLMAGLARRRLRPSRRGAGSFTEHDDTSNERVLRAELSVLADDVIRLEPRVVLNEESRDVYEAATYRYRVAQAALDYAMEPVDLVRVQRVVDEANWSMSRARATLEGRRPPEPLPLQRPGPHGEPAVGVDDRHRTVYVDSPVASGPAGSAPEAASSVACCWARCWAVLAVAGWWRNTSTTPAKSTPTSPSGNSGGLRRAPCRAAGVRISRRDAHAEAFGRSA